ncbi:MAG: hypothetical protein QNJ55_02955 [Xenococcus sp. MO_188.B8]|nr:hypothetical protein [Xenococcus sp. MO_188.B8]
MRYIKLYFGERGIGNREQGTGNSEVYLINLRNAIPSLGLLSVGGLLLDAGRETNPLTAYIGIKYLIFNCFKLIVANFSRSLSQLNLSQCCSTIFRTSDR